MNPAGTRRPEGGAAASWPSNGISSGISNGISNGTRVHGGWGEAWRAGGERTRPGFPERLRRKEPRRLPDPGSGLKTPALDPAGTRRPEGGAAASWPSNGISSGISSGISNGISSVTRVREGWGDGAGRRKIGRVRLSSSGPVGKGLADLRIRGAGSKPRQWVVVFAATWAAAKDGGGDRWQRPGPSRRAPKAPGDRLSPAEQRH
jgi:hypothetical protein